MPPAYCTLLALAILAVAALPGLPEALEYRRDLGLAHWWRLPAAHLAHWGPMHAITNAAALLGLAAMGGRRCPGPAWLVACALLCSLLIHAWLPDITHYRGASTLASLLLPAALTSLWLCGAAGRTLSMLALCAFLAQALAGWAGLPYFSTLPTGVRSTWEVHLAAFALGSIAAATQRRRVSSPSS